MTDYEIVVIGAGPAGMVAAAEAQRCGRTVCVLEKANKSGVKILMSGGTRCNLTHDCDAAGIIEAFGKNGRFLRQALAALSPRDVVNMFHRLGVPTKVEDTGKVFPASDRALDVCRALESQMETLGVTLQLGTAVQSVTSLDGSFSVVTEAGTITAEKVIVTVGGMSYPGCGTVGDGYRWMKQFGHRIVSPRPALVPVLAGQSWTHQLQGVTLPEAHVSVGTVGGSMKKGVLASRTGSLLFTHFGFSGPAAMDVSRAITDQDDLNAIEFRIALLPHWDEQAVQQWFLKVRADAGSRQVGSAIAEIIPRRLALGILGHVGISPSQRFAELSSLDSRKLRESLLLLRLPIQGTRGFKKAEVTAGGVSIKEVDPRTMESRLVDGLYIAGELLDLDGWIGGYNFQSAFSTGYIAGVSASKA